MKRLENTTLLASCYKRYWLNLGKLFQERTDSMAVAFGSTVFISGANGFIALHIVNDLLQAGYTVIGSARSQDKADRLLRQFNNPRLSIEIVPDLSKLDAFDDIFCKYGKDIKVVLHTASPFHYETTDCEADLLVPAVNGTKSILQAIKKYAAKSVERVVLTSSDAAVAGYEQDTDPKLLLTEESWNPITWAEARKDPEAAYYGSKTFAEKAAWEFLKENRDEVIFELSTINPVWVFGPQLFDENVTKKLNTSCQYINDLVHSTPETEIDSELAGGYIDVRDVSKAHLLAFEKDGSIGKRLVLCAGRFTLVNIVDILNEDFDNLTGKIAKGNHDASLARLKSLAKFNYSKTNNILGIKFLTFQKTIDDTAAQIMAHSQ